MAETIGTQRRSNSDLLRRIVPAFSVFPSARYGSILIAFWIACFVTVFLWHKSVGEKRRGFQRASPLSSPRPLPNLRHRMFNLRDFGAVADGRTVNTAAFEKAVAEIERLGGGQLNVPAGKWLTAPFNLTSHMTLFLAEDAVILGIEDETHWPLMPPLPSYGYGREHRGLRYGSLIHGQKLQDVEITDSCENVFIENCYISVGDDGIAIKSGWDQYGIAYSRPSTNIHIRNLVVRSVVSAGVSIRSEMSGGVSNITVENVLVWSSRRGVRIKTAPGRGGYVRHISYRNLTFDDVRVGIVIKTDYNEHPDGYDPKALPVLENISFIGVHGQSVRVPVRIEGSREIPVKGVVFRDMSVGLQYKKKRIFQCSYVQGKVYGNIFPVPCENLDRYDERGQLISHSSSQNATDVDYDF